MARKSFDKDAVIARLKREKADLQSQVNDMRDIIEEGVAAECGCVVIEGIRTSAVYQDLVGILLANNYAVEIIPLDDRKKLKIIIKEGE